MIALKKNYRIMKLYSFKTVLLFIVFISFLAFNFPNQSNRLLMKIEGKLESYYDMGGPEKAYLETDRDTYVPGDTIWFKTYIVDGIAHGLSDKSRVAYVELVDGNDSIVAKRKVFIDGASGVGDFSTPKNFKKGEYNIRTPIICAMTKTFRILRKWYPLPLEGYL